MDEFIHSLPSGVHVTLRNHMTGTKRFFLVLISLLPSLVFGLGCAYRMGYSQRGLPEGHQTIAIPVFKNKSDIMGIETAFTNSLIRQFATSKVAKVVDGKQAPVVAEGEIVKIELVHEARVDANELIRKNENATFDLPPNTVLTTQYRVYTTVSVVLRRKSDKHIIWEGSFRGEGVYPAPQVGTGVVNSVNALYNHNARLDVIETMSTTMMAEAHDRLTENF
jgi:hypothetical protein